MNFFFPPENNSKESFSILIYIFSWGQNLFPVPLATLPEK